MEALFDVRVTEGNARLDHSVIDVLVAAEEEKKKEVPDCHC